MYRLQDLLRQICIPLVDHMAITALKPQFLLRWVSQKWKHQLIHNILAQVVLTKSHVHRREE